MNRFGLNVSRVIVLCNWIDDLMISQNTIFLSLADVWSLQSSLSSQMFNWIIGKMIWTEFIGSINEWKKQAFLSYSSLRLIRFYLSMLWLVFPRKSQLRATFAKTNSRRSWIFSETGRTTQAIQKVLQSVVFYMNTSLPLCKFHIHFVSSLMACAYFFTQDTYRRPCCYYIVYKTSLSSRLWTKMSKAYSSRFGMSMTFKF